MNDYSRIGRDDLISMIIEKDNYISELKNGLTVANGAIQVLSHTLELVTEVTNGINLPGWTCTTCQAFNGSAKEELTLCRACSQSKPKK
jgi:hypothetical protein